MLLWVPMTLNAVGKREAVNGKANQEVVYARF